MIVNSRVMKGKCPICGAANCACGGPTTVIAVDERVTRATGAGTMMRFPIGRGVYVQMSEEEARRRGMLPVEAVAEHKMRTVGASKVGR